MARAHTRRAFLGRSAYLGGAALAAGPLVAGEALTRSEAAVALESGERPKTPDEALRGAPEPELLDQATRAHIRRTVRELQTSPLLADLATSGALKVVGAEYQLDSGEVEMVVQSGFTTRRLSAMLMT